MGSDPVTESSPSGNWHGRAMGLTLREERGEVELSGKKTTGAVANLVSWPYEYTPFFVVCGPVQTRKGIQAVPQLLLEPDLGGKLVDEHLVARLGSTGHGQAQKDNVEPPPCGLTTCRESHWGRVHCTLGGRQRWGPGRTWAMVEKPGGVWFG